MIRINNKLILTTLILSALFLFSADGFSKETSEKSKKKTKTNFVIGDNKMPVHAKGIQLPKQFLRGIYLNSANGTKITFIKNIIPKAKEAGVNCFVIDVAPYNSMKPKISSEVVRELIDNGIYPIARIVAFQNGLTVKAVAQSHLDLIYKLVDESLKAGFKEIQLDYIRYADDYVGTSLKNKYSLIANLLKNVKDRINNPEIPLATDVFGRIVYNYDDVIGQKLENMADSALIICPMVYPSHYYPDKYKLKNPYFTVRQSTIKGLNRIGKSNFIMPYLQAFKMNIRYTKYSMEKYMEVQVQAVEDTAARGWIFWNAMNQYNQVFSMLKDFYKRNPNNLLTNNPSGYNAETGAVSKEADERWTSLSN